MYLNSSHCSTILGMEFYSTRRMPVRKFSSRPAIRLLLVSWRSKVVDGSRRRNPFAYRCAFPPLFVFLLVSRKRGTGPSHPQSATPNRRSTPALMTLLGTVSTLRSQTACRAVLAPAFSSNVPARQGRNPVSANELQSLPLEPASKKPHKMGPAFNRIFAGADMKGLTRFSKRLSSAIG